MNPPSPHSPDHTLRAAAARWTVRRDRGLSAAESIEYELWLAADPSHAAAMPIPSQRHGAGRVASIFTHSRAALIPRKPQMRNHCQCLINR